MLAGDTFYATALPDSSTGDATAQSRQALVALENSLHAAGLTFSDVVNIHVTLADARSFPAFEAVYSSAFAALLSDALHRRRASGKPRPLPADRGNGGARRRRADRYDR